MQAEQGLSVNTIACLSKSIVKTYALATTSSPAPRADFSTFDRSSVRDSRRDPAMLPR
jgi:hypothetical protein